MRRESLLLNRRIIITCPMPKIVSVSGITLRVSSMPKSLHFYQKVLGMKLVYGDAHAAFCSFDANGTYLNLELSAHLDSEWGRIIFYCDDVDKMHEHLKSNDYQSPVPKDAPWGERFFHVKDPDGHELSMAQRLRT